MIVKGQKKERKIKPRKCTTKNKIKKEAR